MREIDFSKPLYVTGTAKPATVLSGPDWRGRYKVKADWFGRGEGWTFVSRPWFGYQWAKLKVHNEPYGTYSR